ncbi:MAG: glycosyltransferase family 4 protein, partial [Schleiferiaceae bacterium]
VPPGPTGWNTKVRSVLNLSRPDVLHVHGSGGDTAYLFVRIIMQWGQRIPRIISEHQHFGDGPLPRGTQWTHRFANVRTAVSPFLAARFNSVGHVNVVPNCWNAPRPDQLRQPHSGGRRVLHIGDWVDATKGISPLLEAWRIHSERNPLDHLTLVGDGVDRPLLEPLAKATPNCTWLGRMAPTDLESEMGRHDILIVNSPRETFSMVVGQARERGLHVLSTRCGGPESIYLNVSGITYRDGPSHDIADLASALHGMPLASDPANAEELKIFRPKDVASQFTELYRSVGVKI